PALAQRTARRPTRPGRPPGSRDESTRRLLLPPACLPLVARLAPDLDRRVLVGCRQPPGTLQRRPEALGHLLRRQVLRRDAVDEVVPAQVRQRPVDRGGRGFGGVALAPGIGMEGIADLVARPALGLPRPGLAKPEAAVPVDDREHAEALQHPRTGLLQEPAPSRGARSMAANVTRGLLVTDQLGEAVEVFDPRHAQHEAFGFESDIGLGHGGSTCGAWTDVAPWMRRPGWRISRRRR